MNARVKNISSLAPGQAPDSDTLYTDDAGRLLTTGAGGATGGGTGDASAAKQDEQTTKLEAVRVLLASLQLNTYQVEALLATLGAQTDQLEPLLTEIRDRLPPQAPDQPLTDAQLRATALPVTAATLPLPAGAATDAVLQALRDRLPAVLVGGRLSIESLPSLGAANAVPAGAASASVALTAAGIRGVKLTAKGTDVRFVIGSTPQTATATSHYLPMGASLTVRVGASQVVAALSDIAGISGSLEITELI